MPKLKTSDPAKASTGLIGSMLSADETVAGVLNIIMAFFGITESDTCPPDCQEIDVSKPFIVVKPPWFPSWLKAITGKDGIAFKL